MIDRIRSRVRIHALRAILAVPGVAGLALAASALAGTPVHVQSTISINLQRVDPVSAYGHVRSDDRRCKSGRKVRLLNEGTGNVLDTYRTGNDGKWRIKLAGLNLKRKPGIDLSARVRPKTTEQFACGRARSGTVPAP